MTSRSYVAVFAGSQMGVPPEFGEAAKDLGTAIANEGLGLVCGGGNMGLMATVADGAFEAGGFVLGLVPKLYGHTADIHPRLSELRLIETIEHRKALFRELALFSIALPGGIGTLDEIADTFNWHSQPSTKQPCAMLNICGYYNHLQKHFENAWTAGLLPDFRSHIVLYNDSPGSVVNYMLRTFNMNG